MSNIGKKIKTAGSNIINSNIHINNKNQNNSKNISIYSNSNINKSSISNVNNKTKQKPKPSTCNPNQRERNIILMQEPSGIQGGGLWCQAPRKKLEEEEKPYVSIIPQIKEETKLLFDTEKMIDKKLIDNLRAQISELSSRLNEKIKNYTDAQFRAERAENLNKIIEEDLKSKNEELKTYKESSIEMQQDIESLNEALNSAKKEISRLQNELNEECAKNKELNNKLSELLIDKDKDKYLNNDEVTKLQKRIAQLIDEKENLMKVIHSKNDNYNNKFNEENLNQQLRDKDKILKSMEITMNKALAENLELKKKLAQEEQTKAQLNNIITKKNNINEELKTQVEAMKICVGNNLQEAKWNKSKMNQKDSNIKMMKDKLAQKDEEIQKLNKKIENLNKKLKNKKNGTNETKEVNDANEVVHQNPDNSKEVLIPVKAKPQLFGPDPKDFDYQDPDLEKDIFG